MKRLLDSAHALDYHNLCSNCIARCECIHARMRGCAYSRKACAGVKPVQSGAVPQR